MARQTTPWKRNIDGLQRTAQQKAVITRQRAEEAIALLLREHRPITFKAVAETARVSTAWLYANEDIKQRILHLRTQQTPETPITISLREQACAKVEGLR